MVGDELTIVLTPAAELDAVLTLYDSTGDELARADSHRAGGAETISYQGTLHDQTVYLRVGAFQYATADDYELAVNFETTLPHEMTGAEGFAYFHSDGVSHDTQTFSNFAGEARIDDPIDVDSFLFSSDREGMYTVFAGRLSGDVRPAVAVYDAATGSLLAFERPAPGTLACQLSLPLAARHLYIVAVADTHHAGTGDVEIVIEGSELLSSTPISVHADGTASANGELDVPEDSDFFHFIAPADADGSLTLTVSPSWIGLDAAVILFDAAGNELAKSYLLGSGEDEVIAFGGVTPSTTYFLTVLSKDYATQGQYDVSLQFGLVRGSIHGTKFYDLDQDGVRSDVEPGLAGWVIYVDLDGDKRLDPLEPFAQTDHSGQYALEDLPLGTREIREEDQNGWTQTAPPGGSRSVELTVGAPHAIGLDFGNHALPQIHGVKWDDLDGDSVHDADEPGLAGWTIYLDLNGNGQLDPDEPATRTNIQGEYWFAGLAAGSYVVAELLPPNWVQTSPAVATECVSVDNAGNPAADTSGGAAITPDGRLVAFEAYSANLVPNDTNAWPDIFVFDRQSRTMERVSVDSAGQESNQQSHGAAISDDGRFVAFYSVASNLVPEDTNIRQDAFVFDRQTRTTERVSVDSAGNQANDSSLELSISGDGRFVAFESLASNLTPGDTNNQFDIFVFDRQTRATERVSVSSAVRRPTTRVVILRSVATADS